MRKDELIAYGIGSIILVIIIYNTWHLIVGALALFGLWFVWKEINNRPPGQ